MGESANVGQRRVGNDLGFGDLWEDLGGHGAVCDESARVATQ
jgi:hypothetical protein